MRLGRRLLLRFAVGLTALLGVWAVAAYVLLPLALRHHERQPAAAGLAMVTRTGEGMPGDPINVGVVGTGAELVAVMHAAGWVPADPITLRTSLGIVGSVVFDRPDPRAPVSPLFYEGRQQDLAFEKPVGTSAERRQHVRFWQALERGREGRPVWLGAATLDAGVGFSHYTGAVTHRIAPDIDGMRDRLSADLARTGRVTASYEMSGIGPTLRGRNGEGDPYRTDGEVRVSVIAPEGRRSARPPVQLPPPPMTALKNAIWPYLAGTGDDRE